MVATHTPGLSATQLQRYLGTSSYKTAWYLLQRLRRAMVNDHRTPLRGRVEADETLIGGPAKGKKGRGVARGKSKSLVLGMVEVLSYKDASGTAKTRAGRARLAVVDHADEETIRMFLDNNFTLGSWVQTAGWRGYSETALFGLPTYRQSSGFSSERKPFGATQPQGLFEPENLAPGNPSWG